MFLAKDAHEKFEEFYREFFDERDRSMPKINIYARRGADLITRILNINGITFGRRIFIRPQLITSSDDGLWRAPKALIAHELAHVLQYQRLGFIKFFYTYLKGYWQALKKKEKWDANARMQAYLEIPHEIEARQFAADFLAWVENRQQKRET
jgi:Domain of unknown function (DUF4157)